MQLQSDLLLYHPLWEKAESELVTGKKIFDRLIDIYVLACAIGIKEDKYIDEFPDKLENPKYIGRNTYQSLINQDLADILDFLLLNAIINTKKYSWDDELRLEYAFAEKNPDKFSVASFLNGFANYGIEQIFNEIDSDSSLIATHEILDYFEELVNATYIDGMEVDFKI